MSNKLLEYLLNETIKLYLNEARIDVVKAKYPEDADKIDFFKDIPPKYIDWIGKIIHTELDKTPQGKNTDIQTLKHDILLFDKYLFVIPQKDINQYKNLDQFYDALMAAKPEFEKKAKLKQAKQNSKVLYQDNTWLAIEPGSMEASCYYGAGTQWCISAREKNHYDEYSSQGIRFIFIINKKQKQKDSSNYKLAVSYHPKLPGMWELFDAEDNKIPQESLQGLVPNNIWNLVIRLAGEPVNPIAAAKIINDSIDTDDNQLRNFDALVQNFIKDNDKLNLFLNSIKPYKIWVMANFYYENKSLLNPSIFQNVNPYELEYNIKKLSLDSYGESVYFANYLNGILFHQFKSLEPSLQLEIYRTFIQNQSPTIIIQNLYAFIHSMALILLKNRYNLGLEISNLDKFLSWLRSLDFAHRESMIKHKESDQGFIADIFRDGVIEIDEYGFISPWSLIFKEL